MKQEKIVSIEDRIPKLKQARKKKANRRLIIYLSIFFLLIAIIVYMQSPLSHIKVINVEGIEHVDEQEILKRSELNTETNIWTVTKKSIEQRIEKHPVVSNVEIRKKLPSTIEINVTEFERVGYVFQDNGYYLLLENGNMLSEPQQPTGDAPLLLQFTDESYLQRMTEELKNLPKSILNLISEIYWNPAEEDENKILLYMNDGIMVDSSIRDFSEKMKIYPSIAAQIEPGSKGILHIGVGAYFEKFE
ncbi:cell division protein FtsQ/DivIB [Ornithinibacillus sp. 4-3]|uniref:Cell division protein DivIB n=1 Tax=Ornithinibacillus sp. 4-3 TaxID=3231488 RepID=A0AB39HVQ5_9BACI